MSKKQFTILCGLLLVVIVLQIMLLNQNHQLMENLANVGQYLSEKLDWLTGKANELLTR